MCTGGVLARKVPNHSGASPGQGNKRPAVSLTHLPKRPPVDIEFKNLAYSVSEGRKRGESRRRAAIAITINLIPGESPIRVLAARGGVIIRARSLSRERGEKEDCSGTSEPSDFNQINCLCLGITYRQDVFSTLYRFNNGSLERRRR